MQEEVVADGRHLKGVAVLESLIEADAVLKPRHEKALTRLLEEFVSYCEYPT